MKIQAKIGGELTMHGPGVNWIHKTGDVKDFPEEVGKMILTNNNYEKATVKKSAQEKEITTSVGVKKTDAEKKDKKEREDK